MATEKGVLAALNARTGDVEWRHLATKRRGDVEQTDVLALAKQYLFTLSAGGKYVRKWQASDGTLVWDSATFAVPTASGGAGGEDEGAEVAMMVSDSGRHVVVLSHNTVYFYDAISGVLEWTQTSYVREPPPPPPPLELPLLPLPPLSLPPSTFDLAI